MIHELLHYKDKTISVIFVTPIYYNDNFSCSFIFRTYSAEQISYFRQILIFIVHTNDRMFLFVQSYFLNLNVCFQNEKLLKHLMLAKFWVKLRKVNHVVQITVKINDELCENVFCIISIIKYIYKDSVFLWNGKFLGGFRVQRKIWFYINLHAFFQV